MDTNKSISVVIVNYNVTHEIADCIVSVKRILIDIDIEIIVVDNFSPDRSILELQEQFPDIVFILLEKNYGYAKANNIGVQKSTKPYILLLNPDTIIIEDFVSPIIDFFLINSNVGVCGPQLIYADRSYQSSTGKEMGIIYEAAEAFMFINLFRNMYESYIKKNISKIMKVNWLSGACLVMSKDLFNKVGGFNTQYFLNYEDIDLCKRIEDIGFSNYYFPFLKCIHLDQTSQKKNYESLVFSRYRSRLIYAKYHYNIIQKTIVNILHIIGLIARLLLTPIVYKDDEMKQRFRGYRKALKLLFFNNE